MAAVYVPRSPTTGVLYGVVRAHLTELLAVVDAQADGSGLPGFVVNEFRKFLRCGVLGHGFARVRCGDCAFERLVPFSWKARAICPSCGGRRMAERAAHLVGHVLPADVPVRQWVLAVRTGCGQSPPAGPLADGHGAEHAVGVSAISDTSTR